MNTTTSPTQYTDADREAMNSALRGELSAVETYQKSIDKFEDTNVRSSLSRIRDEHKQSIEKLRTHIREMGGTPSESSGAWGTLTNVVTAGAKVLGPQTVLSTLKQGEEFGIGTYEKIINAKDSPTCCKNLVHSELLPRCQAHIQALDSMSKTLSAK